MKSRKGFVQIPLLIAIIAGVLVVGGGGYFGIKQYQNYRAEKIESEKQAQTLAETQNKSLEEAQQEIEKLKEESAEAKKKQETLEQKVSSGQQKPAPQNLSTSISAAELEPYLTGVGRIDCTTDSRIQDYSNVSVGSGSLWSFPNIGYTILTNQHVVSITPSDYSFCTLSIADAGDIKADQNRTEGGFWWLDMNSIYSWNKKTDVALLKITHDFIYGDPPTGLNYSIGSLPLCKNRMSLNSPVIAVGFPATTIKKVEGGIAAYRTATNGIISAHDESAITDDGLPAPNYFVSAKIDSGNSGGIAFSKDNGKLCVLGIPTWVNVGNFETQGVIQNIHNVMYNK